MNYILDTNVLVSVFRHYFFDRFPSFWKLFDEYKSNSIFCSVREVRNEIKEKNDTLTEWAKMNSSFFHDPTVPELEFIQKIYAIEHFQYNLEHKKMLKGGPFADPFVIAKANLEEAVVITDEKYKENGAKIPNICKHFGIECFSFEEFMNIEKWTF